MVGQNISVCNKSAFVQMGSWNPFIRNNNKTFSKVSFYSELLTLSGWGGGGEGGGLRGPDDQTHSCQSETSHSVMPKLYDFLFLSLRYLLTKF